jgi:hypothetical protein
MTGGCLDDYRFVRLRREAMRKAGILREGFFVRRFRGLVGEFRRRRDQCIGLPKGNVEFK